MRVVHGDDLLYRFFRDLFVRQPEQAAVLAQSLIEATGIWFPRDLYAEWPVLAPFVVRDPTCRGSRSKGIPDSWSAPNAEGFLRDDNSIIKAIPRSLLVAGPLDSHLQGARMGTEFVASHIWRVVNHDDLASRIPLLNSFVPNLVWLPSQIAKLSDQEGSPLQRVLQAISYSIYRYVHVPEHLKSVVDEAWSLIPEPDVDIIVDPDNLNWFVPTDRFRATRAARLRTVTEAFARLAGGEKPVGKVISSRYSAGIGTLTPAVCRTMVEHLNRFAH